MWRFEGLFWNVVGGEGRFGALTRVSHLFGRWDSSETVLDKTPPKGVNVKFSKQVKWPISEFQSLVTRVSCAIIAHNSA